MIKFCMQHGSCSYLQARSPVPVYLSKVAGTEWVGLDNGAVVSTEAESLPGAGLAGPLAGKVGILSFFNN